MTNILVLFCGAVLSLTFMNPIVAFFSGMVSTIIVHQKTTELLEKVGSYVLKLAIILLGFILGAEQVLQVANDNMLLVFSYVVITITIGFIFQLILRTSRKYSILSATGTAICGATAVSSVSPLINSDSKDLGSILSIIFLLNAFAMLLFPVLGDLFNLSQKEFGVWVALAVHDTSSVLAISSIYGSEANYVATAIKLLRTLFLVPLLLVLSYFYNARLSQSRFPLFIILFLLAALCSSYFEFSNSSISFVNQSFDFLIVIALFIIGMQVNIKSIKEITIKSFLHTVCLWISMTILSLITVIGLA
jgi:uncharacterized integral membrane protein (TIGR00698 family)